MVSFVLGRNTARASCLEAAMIICVLLLALMGIPQGGTVSGTVLDREGKPLLNAHVKYTHIGEFTNAPDANNRISESGTGKVYQTKTNKKGEFTIISVTPGIYRVEITDASGAFLYSSKAYVGDNADTSWSNVLKVDLSSPSAGDVVVRQQNSIAAQVNRLIPDLHSALDAHNWPHAADLLHQLIALNPNKWEYYQNLGSVESAQQQYADAVASYQKGVALEQKLLAEKPDSPQIKSDLSAMMIAEADALLRVNKLDDAMKLYDQAAALAPQPAMAYFHACNAQSNRGSPTAAIELCGKAIAADPDQWEFYQTMAGAQNASGKFEDALGTYQSGIQAAQRQLAAKPDSVIAKNGLGQMLNAEGNLYSQHNQYDKAIAVFNESAKVSAYAAMPLFNVCATYYNMNRLTEAVAACNQAIAADPAMAEAYYIKASSLFGRGTLDHGKYNAPEGTRETLNKYLELSPFGEHANYVREMLEKLDSTIDTAYKPSKTVKK
jgi:tetratricopeptide (TPR) repeat protein